MFIDARGHPVLLSVPFTGDDLRVGKRLLPMRHAGTQRAVYYTIIVVGFAAYLAAFPISAGIADRWLGNFVFLGIPVAILAATLLALSWLDRRVIKPRLATFRLLRGLCAGCRYSIAAISPDPDGCTVCPECGAAWKIPPQTPNNLA